MTTQDSGDAGDVLDGVAARLNATVYTNPLEVHTHFPTVRSAFTVEVAPDTDLAIARRVAVAAMSSVEDVHDVPPPEVVAVEWTATALRLECRRWSAPQWRVGTAVVDRGIQAVQEAYAAAGIRQPADHLLVDLRRDQSPPHRDQRDAPAGPDRLGRLETGQAWAAARAAIRAFTSGRRSGGTVGGG